MRYFSQRFSRTGISLGVAALLALGAAVPTFAAGETGVTVTGGTLSGGAVTFAPFSGVNLNGAQQVATSSWSIADLSDARGTGAGWNHSLTLTQLKEFNGAYVVDGKSLATSSLKTVAAPSVSKVDSTSSETNTVTPIAANTPLDTGNAIKLLAAAVDGGMGSYSFSVLDTTLTIPANAYALTYKADATVSLTTGP